MEFKERPMTSIELADLSEDGIPGVNLVKSRKNVTPSEKFELELQKNEQIATSNALPFARHAARDDFKKAIKIQVDKQLKLYGPRIERKNVSNYVQV